ncbi:hypothetical protein [Photorhabdus viridis]|uniref:hypothetical protein n=1 Tax=Photorhabdus viridis TaxID=3163327 RepID=UPI003306C7C3
MQCRKEQDDVKNALSKRRVISPAVIWLLAGRHPAYRHIDSMSTTQALAWNVGTCRPDVKGAASSRKPASA